MPLSKLCGSSRFTTQTANKLAKMGHDVTVIANKDSYPPENNFRYLQVDTPPYGSWRNCLSDEESFLSTIYKYLEVLFKAHREYKFDILHVQHLLFSTIIASIFKDTFGIPFVATCHGTETFESDGNMRMQRFFRYAENASHITADSDTIIDDIHKFISFSANKVSVVNTAVDIKKFHQSADLRAITRKNLRFKPSDRVLLYAGRLVQEKGILEVPHIYKNLLQSHQNLKLLIVGDGPMRPNLEKSLSQLGLLNENCKLMGFVHPDSMPDYYNASDVFLMPSLWNEPFATASLEAMACGCVVVAYARGGVAKMLQNRGFESLVSKQGNIEDFVDKVGELLSSQAKMSDYSRKLQNLVRDNLSWEISTLKLVTIYNDVLKYV
ncbi:MAG: glycosyltransferase family 4 protein [Patescibacteria group bacterium]